MLETSLCAVACYHMLPKLDVRFQGLQKFLWKYLPALFASFGHKEKTNHVHKLPSPWMWLWWLWLKSLSQKTWMVYHKL